MNRLTAFSVDTVTRSGTTASPDESWVKAVLMASMAPRMSRHARMSAAVRIRSCMTSVPEEGWERSSVRGHSASVVLQKFASHRECRGAGSGVPPPLGVGQARRRGIATRAPRPKAVVRGGGTPQGRMHRCSSRATFMLVVSAQLTARRSSAARSMAETLLGHHTRTSSTHPLTGTHQGGT